MKYTAALLALVATTFSAPVTEMSLSKRSDINYVQNYNGGSSSDHPATSLHDFSD